MNLTKSFFAFALSFLLVFISFQTITVQSVSAQETNVAVRRGYRTGYSDGYMSGYRDSIENAAKSYAKHDEYTSASRAYNKDYGTIDDYRDGYQQGFESGYNTGFEKRSFDATVPVNLNRRAAIASKAVVEAPPITQPAVDEKPQVETAAATPIEAPVVTTQVIQSEPQTSQPAQVQTTAPTADEISSAQPASAVKPEYINYTANRSSDTLTIPVETELIVELLGNIDTETNREGDKFQARIISPNELGGAIIEGRIGKIQKPGRIKRRAEVVLSFDRIVLAGNRWGNFNATLTEVLPVKGDNVKRVDTEGTIEGKSSVRDDTIKIGATTGTGLVIGAVTGGPVGAAVGASVGAAFGVGGVVIERGKNIRLNKNQQLRIKTAYETQIR